MKQAIRPAIFKWRQTEPELILCAVRWYLRYSLSFRDVEELLRERGLEADLWVANYYSARNPLRLSSLVILGVVARMFRCATRSSCWCT